MFFTKLHFFEYKPKDKFVTCIFLLIIFTKKIMLQWHVLYTRSRFEKKVYQELINLGIEAYLPLYKTIRQWKDRKKLVSEPLFRSYCFVHIDNGQFYVPLKIKGVVKYVWFDGKPAVIPEDEINLIKLACNSNYKLDTIDSLRSTPLLIGQKVRIIRGIFSGYEGEIVQLNGNNKVMFKISNIPVSLVIQIPNNFLQVI